MTGPAPSPVVVPEVPGAAPPEAPRPTFLVVGVSKAGTTALYHHLRAHPEVFMPAAKEPAYFAPDRNGRTWEAYLALFAGAGEAKAVGEASPHYFHHPEAPAEIDEALPGVRIVVLLRQPVERALSHYVMLASNRAALRPEPFAPFFRRHLHDVAHWKEGSGGTRSLAFSFYADSLERWIARFGRDRVHVLLYEDLRAEPERTLSALYAFLGVDPGFRPDVTKEYNVGQGLPRSGWVQRLVFKPSGLKALAQRALPEPAREAARRALLRLNEGRRPTLTPDDRRAFTAVYRDDIRRVEGLTGLDLSRWLA